MLVARSPLACAVVDGSERVDRCHVPLVYEQVHLLHVAVVVEREVAARVVVHHHGHLAVGLNLLDDLLHVGRELVQRLLLVGRLVYALVAQRETNDDVLRVVACHLGVAVQQVLRVVAADGDARDVEGVVRQPLVRAFLQLLTVEPGIALEVGSPLSVAYTGPEGRDAVLVRGSLERPGFSREVERGGVVSAVDAYVARLIARRGALEVDILVAEEEDVSETRTGGFGSSDRMRP